MSLTSLKLRSKIGLIVCLMAIPICIFAGLFIHQSQKDLVMAEREMTGIEYETGIWDTAISLSKAISDGTSTPASQMTKVVDWPAISAKYDTEFNVADKSKAFQAVLSGLDWPNKPISQTTDLSDFVNVWQDFMTGVSDGSWLTIRLYSVVHLKSCLAFANKSPSKRSALTKRPSLPSRSVFSRRRSVKPGWRMTRHFASTRMAC
jgi:hypothetical protein